MTQMGITKGNKMEMDGNGCQWKLTRFPYSNIYLVLYFLILSTAQVKYTVYNITLITW